VNKKEAKKTSLFQTVRVLRPVAHLKRGAWGRVGGRFAPHYDMCDLAEHGTGQRNRKMIQTPESIVALAAGSQRDE
jgi:hypothetical protein